MTRDEMAEVMVDVFAEMGRTLPDGHRGLDRGLSDARNGMLVVHRLVGQTMSSSPDVDVKKAESAINDTIRALVGLHSEADSTTVRDAMANVVRTCQFCRDAGQKEYAHDTDNSFANFERIAAYIESPPISRELVLLVYLEKHLDGITSWVNGHQSQRESVHGRICDAIVYLCLLTGMFRAGANG